jgi:hypothetical protein
MRATSFGFGSAWNSRKFSGKQIQAGVVTARARREHQVLQRAAQSDMFFPQEWIERTHVPFGVQIQFDPGFADSE